MIESTYLKDNQKVMKDLKEISTLEPFTARDLQTLLRHSKIQRYRAGEQIITEGSYDGHIYILIYGKARVVKKQKELTVLNKRGDIFGEMSLLGDFSRTASVFAAEDAVCLAIDNTNIDHLTDREKTPIYYILYRVFAETLAFRLRSTSEELINMKRRILKFW